MTFHEVMARRWAKEVALQHVARRLGVRLGEDVPDGHEDEGRDPADVHSAFPAVPAT